MTLDEALLEINIATIKIRAEGTQLVVTWLFEVHHHCMSFHHSHHCTSGRRGGEYNCGDCGRCEGSMDIVCFSTSAINPNKTQ